ncbi:unnamed protein product, partial [Discosporangium mesarthrocarpum]
GPRARTDGKIDVSCPQCAAQYRVTSEMLESKIECSECHRVFFPKTTAGKRVAPPDYTKAYVGFGVAAVVIVGLFIAMSGSNTPTNTNNNTVRKPVEPVYSRGDHPRTHQLVAWARSISDNNQLVLSTHTDMPALAKSLGVANDKLEVIKVLQEGDQGRYLRDLRCDSATLDSE